MGRVGRAEWADEHIPILLPCTPVGTGEAHASFESLETASLRNARGNSSLSRPISTPGLDCFGDSLDAEAFCRAAVVT